MQSELAALSAAAASHGGDAARSGGAGAGVSGAGGSIGGGGGGGGGGDGAGSSDIRTQVASRMQDLQAELDAAIAGECLLCGEVMIRSVADPLGLDYATSDVFGGDSPRGGRDEWAI
jgi:hypothetical protein